MCNLDTGTLGRHHWECSTEKGGTREGRVLSQTGRRVFHVGAGGVLTVIFGKEGSAFFVVRLVLSTPFPYQKIPLQMFLRGATESFLGSAVIPCLGIDEEKLPGLNTTTWKTMFPLQKKGSVHETLYV